MANRQKHTNHRKAHAPRKHTGTQMHKHDRPISVFSLHQDLDLVSPERIAAGELHHVELTMWDKYVCIDVLF